MPILIALAVFVGSLVAIALGAMLAVGEALFAAEPPRRKPRRATRAASRKNRVHYSEEFDLDAILRPVDQTREP